MKWIVRITLILAFISLGMLAALPYLDPMRQKWKHFREAWKIVNSDSSVIKETESTEPVETANPRERIIQLPEVDTATVAFPAENEDPFLMEARRRARENPAAAMAWLQSEAAGKDRLRGMLEVVALWAAQDAENALLWLENNAQGLARIETLHSGIELWSQQDPRAAAEWIDGMVNDGSKLTASKTLAANWVSQNPEEASDWVGQLPIGALRSATAEALIESWVAIDPKAATIWAFSETAFNSDAELFNQSIQKYAEADSEEAGELLRSVTQGHEAPGSVEAYVQTLAQDDPQEAIEWQASLRSDDPLNKPENLQTILQEWSRTDSVAASVWLNETPAGPQRDAGIIGFTKTMSKFEPEAAIVWSQSISDPGKRVETLTDTFQIWVSTQPEEAIEWLTTAEIEPGLRSLLNNGL